MTNRKKEVEVVYNVIYEIKDREIDNRNIEEIITKKLLKVILNTENISGIALNNS